jgi:hypothetical protein
LFRIGRLAYASHLHCLLHLFLFLVSLLLRARTTSTNTGTGTATTTTTMLMPLQRLKPMHLFLQLLQLSRLLRSLLSVTVCPFQLVVSPLLLWLLLSSACLIVFVSALLPPLQLHFFCSNMCGEPFSRWGWYTLSQAVSVSP